MCSGGWNYRQGYVKAATQDPFDWDVNWVKDWLNYYWNGSITTGKVCWNQFYKRTETGWFGPTSNHYCTYGAGSASIDGSTYAYFWNYGFCTTRTDVYYNRNLARGQGWGAIQGNAYVIRENGCHYLLDSYLQVVYTA
jgi:hypothetical protein